MTLPQLHPLTDASPQAAPLHPHADRLFPADPATRAIARELYTLVQDLPIISPHGHVPAQWLADDIQFENPTSFLLTPDHYLTRVLHACAGVSLADLGVPVGTPMTDQQSRDAFRVFCSNWRYFRGTSTRFWMESELHDIFGIHVTPSAATADDIYDTITACLASPEYSARSLYQRFGIDFLATTDDPCDSLQHHRALADDPTWQGHVVPTFRPDAYLEPAHPLWASRIVDLAAAADVDTSTYAGHVQAMGVRRLYFKDHGALSSDHSHADARCERLSDMEAERLYQDARSGVISVEGAHALRRHMVNDQARLATEDGLVMTLHPGVIRNHDSQAFDRYGVDVGGDVPTRVEFSHALRPILESYGHAENFQMVAFSMDETTFSRELAPLAGYYPSLYVGEPWWFIDEADAIARYRASVTGSAGFYKTSGFIDDTRALASIPARHDTARRVDSAFLARLVAEHRLSLDEAAEIAVDLVTTIPRRAFKLAEE